MRNALLAGFSIAIASGADTGAKVWEYRTSNGSALGGQWGAGVDEARAYFGINGTLSMEPGGLRAVPIVWQFDTNREFETVNGVPAKGGAMDGPGPVVSGGMVYVVSGYVSLIGRPGNVLLAFGVD